MMRWQSGTRRRPVDQVNSLGVYLHIPFCDAKCPYCAFYSLSGIADEYIDAYIEALTRESRHRRALLPAGMRLTSIYMGGGTPSLLSVRQLERLCAMVCDVFRPAGDTEWSVECNPGSIDREKLAVLKASGVNRVSLGAQSLDDDILRILGRRHRVAAVLRAVEDIQAADITNWNMDLIACVPGVGERRWRKVLQQAIALQPAHLSVYALTLDEGRCLPVVTTRRTPATLDDARQLRMLRLTHDRLHAHGYRRYEISNYALHDRRCRHHLDCWSGMDYLGLGAGAVSRVGALRRQNVPDVEAYLAALRRNGDAPHADEWLTLQIRAAERLVFGLRLIEGVAIDFLQRDYALSAGPCDWPQSTLRELQQQGMIWRKGRRIGLTLRGFELADAVALELWP